ncbi:hypothetical protein E4U09_004237 [Claviceps aff. purpurea]|uniref:Uncharacterized protein n=1 Tax=Claviceps aff. purpurea TaxID=1967640 RepID=A0A9P7U1T3_9HYPO|nr:hypothetical protein E4U09_004237 [Claviceps aff. purpurea]
MQNLRTVLTEVFEGGTEVVEEIEYEDEDEFSYATLNLHLLSVFVQRNLGP